MLPDDLRKKVEAIGRRRPRRPPLPPVTGEERTGVPLEKALGARVLERPEGACLLVQRRIEEVLPDADEVEALYRHVLERGACDPDRAARHPHLAALLELQWEGAGSLLEYEVLYRDSEEVRLKVTKCFWADAFREIGAADIGKALYCDDEQASAGGFNPSINLTCTKTIMQGGDCCDHCYLLEP